MKWSVNSGRWLEMNVKTSSRARSAKQSIVALFVLLFLSACTDYEEKLEDRYDEWVYHQTYEGTEYESDEYVYPSDVICGTFKDSRDNQTYKAVKIGRQIWMAQNLNFDYKIDSTSYGNHCFYSDSSNCAIFGRTYTWAAAMDSAGLFSKTSKGCGMGKPCTATSQVQGVCPKGWHLPTQDEYQALADAIGGFRTAGLYLKATYGWADYNEINLNGNDAYHFSALPAADSGYGISCYWNSDEQVDDDGRFHAHDILFMYSDNEMGFSTATDKNEMELVRCVANDSNALKDTVKCSEFEKVPTITPESITPESNSSEDPQSDEPSIIDSSSSIPNTEVSSSSFDLEESSSSSSELEEESSSSETAWDYLNPNISYGEFEDARDRQIYKTVKIGSQTWMAQNLNYAAENSYCLYDDSTNCAIYGRLYTWETAKNKATNYDQIQGICPEGWHLPHSYEFHILFETVGDSSSAGTILKSTRGWERTGDNEYGFSALPAGDRTEYISTADDGYIYARRADYYDGSTVFLTSDSVNTFSIASFNAGIYERELRYSNYDLNWFSVRCLKDDIEKAVPCKTETEDHCEYGSVTDNSGRTYKTVKIGSQNWMAENLKKDLSEEECIKIYGQENCSIYTDAVARSYNCPNGWHIPTTTEWLHLITAVGGSNVAGEKLKTTNGWEKDSSGTDDYGFSAFPTGLCGTGEYDEGYCYQFGLTTSFAVKDPSYTDYRYRDYDDGLKISITGKKHINIYSFVYNSETVVRCIQD